MYIILYIIYTCIVLYYTFKNTFLPNKNTTFTTENIYNGSSHFNSTFLGQLTSNIELKN